MSAAAAAPDHVAGFAFYGLDAKRRHLIQHGRRLDLLPPMDGGQMATLHAMLHAAPPEGCADLDVTELSDLIQGDPWRADA